MQAEGILEKIRDDFYYSVLPIIFSERGTISATVLAGFSVVCVKINLLTSLFLLFSLLAPFRLAVFSVSRRNVVRQNGACNENKKRNNDYRFILTGASLKPLKMVVPTDFVYFFCIFVCGDSLASRRHPARGRRFAGSICPQTKTPNQTEERDKKKTQNQKTDGRAVDFSPRKSGPFLLRVTPKSVQCRTK